MTRTSPWESSLGPAPLRPPLPGDLACDIAVVGGGIAGVTAALLLQRAGRRVILIEGHRIGSGETGRTTAHLTEVLDARYHHLEAAFGQEGARLAAESSRAAINRIESFVKELGIECGFQLSPGFLYAESENQLEELGLELEALVRAGADAARATDLPLPFPVAGIVRVQDQARFHPLAYLRGLIEAFHAIGGVVAENTQMQGVDDGTPCRVLTDHGVVTARAVLVMTHVPASNRFAIHTKIAAYRSYAIAARLGDGRYPEGLFWDLADPYHYVRAHETSEGQFLIVGGEDHKTGQDDAPDQRYARLEAYLHEHFAEAAVTHRWSGQIIEPADGLPFIGRNSGSKNIYVATGFSGNGMTFGTVAAILLSDLVLDRPNSWESLFDATRIKPIAQAARYIAENVDFPAQLVRDRVRRGEAGSPDEIPRGEGRLVRSGGKMLAVYRGEDGTLRAHSAICTHLGCHVRWNSAEKSWDCPCHGSRFDTSGKVVNGPAVSALEEAEAPNPETPARPEP